MDPVTVIVTAVTTGAVLVLQEATKLIVKDTYAALKDFIIKKYGDQGDVKDAVKKVEDKPDSDARKSLLREELETAGAGEDEELLKKAQEFLALAKPEDAQAGQQTATISGDKNVVTQVSQQAGDNAIQIGVARDVDFKK